jgi:transposase-like protein
MANAMLDARQEDGSYRRVELITGQRRRRRWTAEEKARIVAESFEEASFPVGLEHDLQARTYPRSRCDTEWCAGC